MRRLRDKDGNGVVTDMLPEMGLLSEVDQVCTEARNGNVWPLAILEAKAGDRSRLANLVCKHGLIAESEPSQFVADLLKGTFKATKREKAIYRKHSVLTHVSLYNWLRVYAKDYPEQIDKTKFSAADPIMKSMEDVYVKVAAELNMSPDAVEKIVTRNRIRISAQP
ncbi:MAG: hypothetical protein KGJ49_13010 [Alphaproteobacteria bacterium]|nr:hypothetical protein [Alphaproteobacteria bacterium]